MASKDMNVVVWLRFLFAALKRNGPIQLFFYLSNLDAFRFIEYSKAIQYLGKQNGGFILDLGSGFSIFPFFLKSKIVDPKCEYVTLDLSRTACEFQNQKRNPKMHQIKCDISALPIKSDAVRSIIAISSIEHVPADSIVFKEIGRTLHKNGKIIVSVPYAQKCLKVVSLKHDERQLKLLHKYRALWAIILKNHVNYFIEQTATDSIMKFYSKDSINNLTSSNGLTISEYYSFGAAYKFFNYLPVGWFIVKDLFIGLILMKTKKLDSANDTGIIFTAVKKIV